MDNVIKAGPITVTWPSTVMAPTASISQADGSNAIIFGSLVLNASISLTLLGTSRLLIL